MMILNMRLEGLPEEIVNELVHNGIASDKSEAIRLMILHYNEHFGIKRLDQYIEDKFQKERADWQAVMEKSAEKIWDNKKDDETWNKY